jgi:hypothetical protein
VRPAKAPLVSRGFLPGHRSTLTRRPKTPKLVHVVALNSFDFLFVEAEHDLFHFTAEKAFGSAPGQRLLPVSGGPVESRI